MQEIYEIREKIDIIKENSIFTIDNDFQYYFFIGQLAYFIEHQSKTNMVGCLKSIELYEDKTNIKVLREYIINRFSIYFYEFNKNYDIFRGIFSAVLIYEPNKLIKEMLDWFYLGVCYDNIILDSESKEDLKLKRELSLSKIKHLKYNVELKEAK